MPEHATWVHRRIRPDGWVEKDGWLEWTHEDFDPEAPAKTEADLPEATRRLLAAFDAAAAAR